MARPVAPTVGGKAALGHLTRSTGRMVLRPLATSDIDEFARVVGSSARAWAPWTPAREAAESVVGLFERELRRTQDGAEAGTHLRLAAFGHDEAMIGMFALNEIVRGVLQSAYASWQVSTDRTGVGFGTEGVQALLDIAFAPPPAGIGLHRVQANIMPSNGPSLRIAEKVGFRHEGRALRYLRIAGHWEDHETFAITREEWSGDA